MRGRKGEALSKRGPLDATGAIIGRRTARRRWLSHLDSRSGASRPPGMTRKLPDRHHRAAREAGGELQHVGGGNRDATGGGREARAGEVEENRAAAPF